MILSFYGFDSVPVRVAARTGTLSIPAPAGKTILQSDGYRMDLA